LNWSIFATLAAIAIPKAAHPRAVVNAKRGTRSIPHAGLSPKAMAISSGKQPKKPARMPIHSISAVTSSSGSTGAARTAS
jgi:hypothetical protein